MQQFLSERCVSVTIMCNRSHWDFFGGMEYNSGVTTKDVDKDSQSSVTCALYDRDGWWYWSCSSSYLNAVYLQQSHVTHLSRIYWRYGV